MFEYLKSTFLCPTEYKRQGRGRAGLSGEKRERGERRGGEREADRQTETEREKSNLWGNTVKGLATFYQQRCTHIQNDLQSSLLLLHTQLFPLFKMWNKTQNAVGQPTDSPSPEPEHCLPTPRNSTYITVSSDPTIRQLVSESEQCLPIQLYCSMENTITMIWQYLEHSSRTPWKWHDSMWHTHLEFS